QHDIVAAAVAGGIAQVSDLEFIAARDKRRSFRQTVERTVDRVAAAIVDDRELVVEMRREAVDKCDLQRARQVDVAVDDDLAVLRAGTEAADLLDEGAGDGLGVAGEERRWSRRWAGVVRSAVGDGSVNRPADRAAGALDVAAAEVQNALCDANGT